MKPFLREQTAFGRHETFALRYGWLTKGMAALDSDEAIFEQENAIVTLGVGKNMVSAIRYWLQAAQFVVFDKSVAHIDTTARSLMIDPAWDTYLEDDASIWLLHWLIASNAQDATTFFWFFNRFHKSHFSAKELMDELTRFANAEVTGRFSATTLKSDANVLLRSYLSAQPSDLTSNDESLDCPLADLRLMHQGTDGRIACIASARPQLPAAILGFAVMQLFVQTGKKSLPVQDLMRSDGVMPAPGAVFRLTEDALLEKLEQLIHLIPGVLTLRETAGIHQLYLIGETELPLSPVAFLQTHYNRAGSTP